MTGDADFDKVALLLHMDGVDGSTIFTDSSAVPKTVMAEGNAAIRTAQSKFGGASAYFDGSTAYITASGGAEYDLGTISTATNFTAEFWYRPGNVGAAEQNLLSHATPGSSGEGKGGWRLFAVNGTLVLAISAVSNATNPWYYLLSANSAVFAVSAWYHVALVMSAGVPTLYVDGVAVATTVSSGNAIYAATPIGLNTTKTNYGLRVGASYTDSVNPTLSGFAQGNIDDLRISKGVARYTANFSPPTEPFPNTSSAYALSGTVTGSTGSPAARAIRAQREDTGAYVGGVISNATTGAYTITTVHPGEHTVVAYPVTGEGLPALVHHGVIPA